MKIATTLMTIALGLAAVLALPTASATCVQPNSQCVEIHTSGNCVVEYYANPSSDNVCIGLNDNSCTAYASIGDQYYNVNCLFELNEASLIVYCPVSEHSPTAFTGIACVRVLPPSGCLVGVGVTVDYFGNGWEDYICP